jgi:hypothetical protein
VKSDGLLILGGVAVLAAVFLGKHFLTKTLMPLVTPPPATGSANDPGVPPPASAPSPDAAVVDTVAPTMGVPYKQQYIPSVGLWWPYATQLPVTTTEPDVSAGIPEGYSSPVLVGQLTPLERFPGDLDVLTQCPGGNLQGGSASSMQYLLYSTDSAAVAWRARYCS